MAEPYVTPAQTNTLAEGVQAGITTTCNWTEYRSLPRFSMRNGTVEDVSSLLIKATIPTAYHWVPIAGLACADAVDAVDGFIRSHMRHIRASEGAQANDALTRKQAIVLGTMRAVATTFYEITNADLISGEVATPYLVARKTRDGIIHYDLANGITAHDDLTTALDLNVQEQAVVAALVKCGAGVVPMQGYSIIMTGHHYLSDVNSQSRKVFDVVERAFWRDTAIGDWFTADLVSLQDVAWHKSTHPIQISVKEQLAMSAEVPEMLKAAKAGACASRLPATETELRAANSYLTCIRAVTHLLKGIDVPSNYRPLEEAVAAVECFPVKRPAITRTDLSTVPAHVSDRQTALHHLGSVLRRSEHVAAFCYGFYSVLSEQNQQIGAEGAGVSLTGSHSLKKLAKNCYPSYIEGQGYYNDYVAIRNERRADGTYPTPNLNVD